MHGHRGLKRWCALGFGKNILVEVVKDSPLFKEQDAVAASMKSTRFHIVALGQGSKLSQA